MQLGSLTKARISSDYRTLLPYRINYFIPIESGAKSFISLICTVPSYPLDMRPIGTESMVYEKNVDIQNLK